MSHEKLGATEPSEGAHDKQAARWVRKRPIGSSDATAARAGDVAKLPEANWSQLRTRRDVNGSEILGSSSSRLFRPLVRSRDGLTAARVFGASDASLMPVPPNFADEFGWLLRRPARDSHG